MTSAEQPARRVSWKVAAYKTTHDRMLGLQKTVGAEAHAPELTRVECKCGTCRAEGGRAAMVPPDLAAEHGSTAKGRAYLVHLAHERSPRCVESGVFPDRRPTAP